MPDVIGTFISSEMTERLRKSSGILQSIQFLAEMYNTVNPDMKIELLVNPIEAPEALIDKDSGLNA